MAHNYWPQATNWTTITSALTRFTRQQTANTSIWFYMSSERIKRTHKTGMTNDAGYRAAGHWAKWRHWHTFQSTTNTLLSPLLVVGKYLFLKCLFPVPHRLHDHTSERLVYIMPRQSLLTFKSFAVNSNSPYMLEHTPTPIC